MLNDERDAPFLSWMVRAALWALLSIPALYLHYRWWMTPLFLAVTMGYFFPPFTLMLHCTSHRPLFRKQYGWMNELIPWVLGPFFGHTPGTYAAHHLGMHHPENNLWSDGSSTLRYRRDSFPDFMKYYLRFLVVGLGELVAYLWKSRRTKLGRRALVGEVLFGLGALGLARLNLAATLTLFVVPVVLARFAMMAGNWAQHAFVDAASPGNAYRNSITCTETVYNDRCFNDGYHIGHHLRPRLHWTEMRRDFEENRARYAEERAIVFTGLDYSGVWLLLMLKAYARLARQVVVLDGVPRSDEQIIRMLRERVRPVEPEPIAAGLPSEL